MPVLVDNIIDGAHGLGVAMENHKDIIAAKANGQKKKEKLQADIEELLRRNSVQMRAQSEMEQKTQAEHELIRVAQRAITQVQNAARSAFRRDKAKLREFKIGTQKPETAKGMITMLEYFTRVVQEYTEVLLANGMSEEDIANVSALYSEMIAAEASQENAKKLRNAATAARDKALSTLRETVTATRSFLKAAFRNDPAALEEFKPISRSRGKSRPAPPSTPS